MALPEPPTMSNTSRLVKTGQELQAPTELLEVSVVVPLYNERECVSSLLTALVDMDVQLGDKFQFDFILVDDGSTDGTPDWLSEAIELRDNFQVIRHKVNQGIAAAIHTGIRDARHEVVVSIDADGSYDARLIEQMAPLLTPDVDLVTASPYHPEGGIENVPRWRIWLSKLASSLYRLVMRQKLHCYTSCFRVYRRSKVIDLVPQNAGYVGVAELLWRVDRQGSKIVEHPAILKSRVAGHSKMKIFRSSLSHLRLLTQVLRDRIGH